MAKKKTLNEDSLDELQKILNKEPDYYYKVYESFRPDPFDPTKPTLYDFFDGPLEFFKIFDSMIGVIKKNLKTPLVAVKALADLRLSDDQMSELCSYIFHYFAVYKKNLPNWPKYLQCVKEVCDYGNVPEYDPFGFKESKRSAGVTDSDGEKTHKFTKIQAIALLEALMFQQTAFEKTTNAAKARFIAKLTGYSAEKLEQEIGYFKGSKVKEYESLVRDWQEVFAERPNGRPKR